MKIRIRNPLSKEKKQLQRFSGISGTFLPSKKIQISLRQIMLKIITY